MIHTIAAFMSAYQFWKFAQFILSITRGGVTLMLMKLETITFKEGDWFKLFRNHESPESDVVTSKTGVTSLGLPRQMFIDFQAQVKVLWCRIFAVKRGEVKNNIMFTSSGMPKHVRRNLHHFVWGYPRDDQEQIDEFFSWNRTTKEDLMCLINSKNPITRLCDELFNAFLKDAFEHISESQALENERVEKLRKAITNGVMIDAGMLPVDKDLDDQENKPMPEDGTEKPAPTTPVSQHHHQVISHHHSCFFTTTTR